MSVLRLSFALVLIAVLTVGCAHAKISADASATFPNDFVWGAASAAYQVEGAWNVSDKGQSIWDVFSHTKGVIHNDETGDDADKFYYYYEQDADLMKQLGVKHFRFSLSWPRLLPNGTVDQPSQAGIDFYNALLNALDARGIEPWVTLYHWDLPAALNNNSNVGGWLDPNISNLFNDYADFCFNTFGGKVKKWLTVNEISSFAWIGYGNGLHAPGRCSSDVVKECNSVGGAGNSSTEPYIVAHHAIIAHAKAVQTYNQKYRATQGGTIGFTFNAGWALPYNPNSADDLAAVETNAIFNYAWYADPIVFGDYPQVMKDLVGSRLPTFTANETALLKNITVDFLGLNHYTSRFVKHTGVQGNSWISDGQYEEHTSDAYGNAIGDVAAADWLWVYPAGFRQLLNWIDNRYKNGTVRPDIYIFENGVCSPQEINGTYPEVLNDTFRVSYLQNYLANLVRAIIEDGVQVKGYFTWSITDNFEWAYGYQIRFGLVYVDYTLDTKNRTVKASGNWYHDAITNITGGQNLTTVLGYLGLNETRIATEDVENLFLSS